MTTPEFLTDQPLAGKVVGTDFEGWSEDLRKEFEDRAYDGHVGSRLLSETPDLRVWEIRLAPGERWHAHRHVLDYFWTSITGGKSLQHTSDGTTREVEYEPGETRHFQFAEGEYLLHDIANAGDTDLIFSTVEHIKGSNTPLPLEQPAAF